MTDAMPSRRRLVEKPPDADRLRAELPKLAAPMDDAETDVLAYMTLETMATSRLSHHSTGHGQTPFCTIDDG